MLKKINSIKKDIDRYSGVLGKKANEYGCSVAKLKRDCFFARLFHGADAEQYVAFEMWKLNKRERKTFVTLRRSLEIEKIFNIKYDETIGKKHLFNKTYGKFVKRKWLFAPDATKEEIVDFLQSNSQCLVKPTKSSKGRGIEKIFSEDVLKGDTAAFVENLVKQECVIEEVIKQNKLLSEINPTSVNSLRIATVRDKKGEVKVIGASLKVGRVGAFVDNFHAGGIQYSVDVDTGIIISAGVDTYGNKYYFHPDSNVKMMGLQIPNWNEVIKTVKEAGTISKTLRYIGWDVAVLEDSCELIEGNSGQGCNGMQQDGKGKLPIIMSCK